MLAKFC